MAIFVDSRGAKKYYSYIVVKRTVAINFYIKDLKKILLSTPFSN